MRFGAFGRVLLLAAFSTVALCRAANVDNSELRTGVAGSKTDLRNLPAAASRRVDFVKDIQPIFAGHCYDCHGEKKQEAQFRLDTKDIALKGGELGPAIVPGKGAESLLVQ